MKYVTDSSFLIALYNNSDSNNKEARYAIHTAVENDEFIIPYISVAEFLIYSSDLEKSIEFCKRFTSNFEPNIQKDLEFYNSIPIKKRIQLKSNDCLILAICKRENATLITFDKKLEKLSNDL